MFHIIHQDYYSPMSRVRTNRSLTEIDLLIQHSQAHLEELIRKEDYIEAEKTKLAIQQMKKDREIAKIRELQRRHQEERQDLASLKEAQSKALFQEWENRLKVQSGDAEAASREMQIRHQMQEQKLREQLQMGSPVKVKQSAQCLNLRRQEACMVKQKNYAQAHLVQQQIAQMERAEREKWMANRKNKIQLAIRHLREKQENERVNLEKNVRAALNQSRKLRAKEEEKLGLKFANLQRELAMKQEKELLAQKGQFTSKGGEGSPLLTKSRLLKSRQ